MDTDELMKIREELFREVRDRRNSTVTVVTRIAVIFIAIVSLKVSNLGNDADGFGFVGSMVVSGVAFAGVMYLLALFRSEKALAAVIVKIDSRLGLYETVEGERLFPEKWLRFGKSPVYHVSWSIGLVVFALVVILVLVGEKQGQPPIKGGEGTQKSVTVHKDTLARPYDQQSISAINDSKETTRGQVQKRDTGTEP